MNYHTYEGSELLPKHLYLCTNLDGVISQNTRISVTSAVRISDVALIAYISVNYIWHGLLVKHRVVMRK